jgi:Leucine-rich repeat (LRR) protein
MYTGLTEAPFELFHMKCLKDLSLHYNNLCSLPSEIALMTTLELFNVRRLKRVDRGLTTVFRSPSTNSRLFRANSVC